MGLSNSGTRHKNGKKFEIKNTFVEIYVNELQTSLMNIS